MTGEKTMLATPVVPRAAGVGVEQRAARTLAALAGAGEVEVVVCRPGWKIGGRGRSHPSTTRLEALPGEALWRRAALLWPRSRVIAEAARVAGRALPHAHLPPVTAAADPKAHVAHFHAFRLAAASALPRRVTRAELDLDDLESQVAQQIADLAKRLGDQSIAAFYGVLARRLAALEASVVPRFDRAYVGSRMDAAWLAERVAVEVRVLPNVVDLPPPVARVRGPGPARFLFVGALAYYPNIDALRVLVDAVMPKIAGPCELHVVGRGAPRWLEAKLRTTPRVVFHGGVPTMAPHLAAADALVVPLRAGGGTRIKLLEAFAHHVPVVATSIGAFGLDVAADRELVIADEPEAIAAACSRFVHDPTCGQALADAAYAFVKAHHQADSFVKGLQR